MAGVPDNGFNAALRRRSRDPCCQVVHEGYRTAKAVDSSLYQVRVKEEEQDRDNGVPRGRPAWGRF